MVATKYATDCNLNPNNYVRVNDKWAYGLFF